MVVKQLNLGFLSKQLGIKEFQLFKESYSAIMADGHYNEKLNDKDLAISYFLNSVKQDFFKNKNNLIEFCNALHHMSQEKIIHDLNLNSIDDIKWNQKTSDYFINVLLIPEKFRLINTTKDKSIDGFKCFEKPDIIFKKLKKYQSNVFYDVFDYITETPFGRCIIQMPTGSGKTRTSMEIVCESINQKRKDVLWLANTEELCDQAFESFKEVWHFLGKIKAIAINHGRISKTPIIQDNTPAFHVCTIQSFNTNDIHEKLKKLGTITENIELIVVDEAHISIAPTYKKAITELTNDGAKLIGLTATPGRQLNTKVGKTENEELSQFYRNKKFELDTGDEKPIEFLRNKGILSNAIFKSIEGSNIANILSSKDLELCILNKKIPKSIEELLTNNPKRNAIIFDYLIELINQGKKILFFGTSITHSKLITSLLSIKGVSAAHIDGDSGTNRSKIIKSFKDGSIQVLCNYGILSTGFDDPKIDVVFMSRPTNSIVLYSQIIGRGLRGPVIGGTDFCEIFTVFDNILDLPNNDEIYNYFDDYFINEDLTT
jgi:DNA repair protein RadD